MADVNVPICPAGQEIIPEIERYERRKNSPVAGGQRWTGGQKVGKKKRGYVAVTP